jgi:DNA-binding NarL/FixJ family response regulator
MKTSKILIVDDEYIHIETIADALEQNSQQHKTTSYEILQANSGQLALQIMEKYAIDLVITDWDMPQTNGIELIEKIRRLDMPIPIPIIMATGVMIKREHLEKALKVGATDFVQKPIDSIEIRARVDAALRTLYLQRQLLEEQKKSFIEKVSTLELLSGQMNKKNKIIAQLKKQAEETQNVLNASFLPQLNKLLKIVNTELDIKKDWQKFESQMQHTYPDFWKKLNSAYPDLTRNEKQLCLYLRNDKNSQEIAELLSVSIRTIEMARYRLRKKLHLPTEIDLTDFIKNL